MIGEVIIPPGSPIKMKLATIFDVDALAVYNYDVVVINDIKEKAYGPRFLDQKIVARLKIYQFFVEINEVCVGAMVTYGRRPVKDAIVRYIDERPDSNDKTGKSRWATIEFTGGSQKTVKYNSLNTSRSLLIPLYFDRDMYRTIWDYYKLRNKYQAYPKQLVGSYYSTKIIDGRLYVLDPVFPKEKTEEELLMEMNPVNKERLLGKLRKERDRIDLQIEILERKIN